MNFPSTHRFFTITGVVHLVVTSMLLGADDFTKPLESVFDKHCYECHDDLTTKGELDLFSLPTDLSDEHTLSKWIRIYDRVASDEMPPDDRDPLTEGEKRYFRENLAPSLSAAHEEQKGTILRRLNRQEYQNTLNDLLGIRLDIIDTLPEDGRSHEFDTVGGALGISMIQMQRYLEIADEALDTAIAKTTSKPEATVTRASYADTRGHEKFIGSSWLKAKDGAVVFFRDLAYPTGMLREAEAKEAGYYKIRVTGYAYQSDKPVTFSVGGTSFARASDKPIYGYFAFPPGKPTTVELTAWMDRRYMIDIRAQGIHDEEYLIKKNGLENYEGPGLAISYVEIEGPIVDEFPTKGHHLIFDGLNRSEIEPRNPADKEKPWYQPKFEVVSEDATEAVIPVLERFAEAAFRRPNGERTIAPYLLLFQQELGAGETFETSLRTALSAMLCSPDFLYLKEHAGKLDDYALASRLSYALSRTYPDKELLTSAASGTLEASINEHAQRLIEDPRFERFVADFTDSWLDLRDIDFTSPDDKLFPEFDRYLQKSMVKETRTYFHELIRENLDVSHIVQSDFAMLNWRLAEHYGIEGVSSPQVERVSLPAESNRGGFITQGSVLKVSANGTNTSPVLRGVWINERILGKHPAPPPPGIPGVEPDIRGAETLRQILEKHRTSENCQSCHEMIDPPGFALESFNPIGGWRDTFRSLGEGEKPEYRNLNGKRVQFKIGQPVDASGNLQDGRSFSGFNEFRELIAEDKDQLAKAFATKFLTFSTGREMGFSDRPEINKIVAASAKNEHRMRDLILLCLQSEIFNHK